MLVLNLANRYIRAVEGTITASGKFQLHNACYTADTRGSIMNGTIVNEEALREVLRDFWAQNNLPRKNVYLVIDSSQFASKVLEIPVQTPKETLQFLAREFSTVERIEDPVYSVVPAGPADKKTKRQPIIALMVARDYIENYLELFRSIGVTISGVESSRSATFRIFNILPEIPSETCIAQLIDDITIMEVLSDSGNLVYASRKRIFSDPGTPGFSQEVVNSLSNVLQFSKTQSLSKPITDVYVCGLTDTDWDYYVKSINAIDSSIHVAAIHLQKLFPIEHVIPGDQNAANYAAAIGGLIPMDKGAISFLSPLNKPTKQKQPKEKGKRSKRAKIIIALCIIGAVLLGVSGFFTYRWISASSQLKKIESYTTRPDVVEAVAHYDAALAEMQSYRALTDSITGLKDTVLGYPKVDGKAEKVVARCASGLVTAEISGYNASTGVMSFETTAADVKRINRFVALLSKEEIFASVDYTGYSQDSEGNWKVKVNCTVAGREEVQP